MSYMSSANPDGHLKLADAPANYTPTEAEAVLTGELSEWVKRAGESRERFIRVWELIQCFIRGDQNLYYGDNGDFVRIRSGDQSRRLFSINNQMKLAVRQLHAKLSKHISEFSISPANGDQDQVQASLAATEFIQWFRHKEDYEVKYLAAMLDVATKGTGFLMLDWDPDAGRRMALCPVCNYLEENIEHLDEDCPACQAEAMMEQEQAAAAQAEYELGALMGNPDARPPLPMVEPDIGQLSEVREGDVVLKYIDPRTFLPEEGCPSIEKMRKWAIREVIPVAVARADYPEFADVIKSKQGVYDVNTIRTAKTDRRGNYAYADYQEHCIRAIYYEAPSSMYPKGRRVVTINDHILVDEGDNPLHFLNRPNVFMFSWDKENETFWSQPFGEHAWHRQKELNENETQQRENAEIMSNGKVLVPNGSGVRPDELTAKAGQVVRYNPAVGTPTTLRLGELSTDVYNRNGIVKGSIFEQATIGLAEQGLMSGETSGRALAIIQAEADQQLGPTMRRINHEAGQLFKGAVQVFRHFAPIDRQYRVVGDFGLQVFTLKDMDLEDGYDLRIEPEDGLSKNQELRMNRIFDMVNLGVFSNPQTGMLDYARFAKAAKLKLPGLGGDKVTAARTRAHYVVRMIEQGETPKPEMWDDAPAHADVMLDWLQTKGYNPKTDPLVKENIMRMFQFYTQMVMFQSSGGMGAPPQPPQAGQANQAGQAPGPGGNTPSGVVNQAANTVQQADKAGEAQARAMTLPREG